ncbi:MAG TPA: RNA polymerase sigma factor [Streptosporangiaceae bacterium]|nr:RNA polymerase sigma factor [Streptosporangiaceae bacterium]
MDRTAVTATRDGSWHPPLCPDVGQPGAHVRDTTKARADDATLIELSGSEPEVFAAIFDRHATEIHRFAARRLGDTVAEDVVGEVFLTAFRRRERFDLTYRDARPWLYGIATNVISRYRHAEARSYKLLARTGADPVTAAHDDDVLARVAASAHRRALAAGLARLHQADRDTLLLVVWGGLSYAETARALQVPVGTVRSRLNRARRKLRVALGVTGLIEPEEGSHHE